MLYIEMIVPVLPIPALQCMTILLLAGYCAVVAYTPDPATTVSNVWLFEKCKMRI